MVEGPPGRSLVALMEQCGRLPLPPYIRTYPAEPSSYQTVYAATPGSAAAPTAGLHFTPGLLKRLEAAGIGAAYLTLHVGLDTFQPIREAVVEDHRIHSEAFSVSAESIATMRSPVYQGGGWWRWARRPPGCWRRWPLAVSSMGLGIRAGWRVHRHLHHPGIPFPGCGCLDHQLPPAAKHRAGADHGLRRRRAPAAGLRRGCRDGVPLLQLRRRHARGCPGGSRCAVLTASPTSPSRSRPKTATRARASWRPRGGSYAPLASCR